MNLIEQFLIEDNDRLFFSNIDHCILINEVRLVPELASDHEEADTKLVAFVHNADLCSGQSAMVRSSSSEIDILVLFLLHQPGVRILIDK